MITGAAGVHGIPLPTADGEAGPKPSETQPRKNSFTKGLRGWANVTNISSLATMATQRKRRSGWGDGLKSQVVGGFRAGESLRRRAKKAKKTVDDDEKLRHNLTSLLLMQRRRKRSDGAVSWRRSEVRCD
ncbi:hypothetical protein [Pandoraea morbifera]|uniref:hypothetical protein n=1 Tax=Pandoraea morbifera TaxID=2508300 RepID=UPI00124084E3|nr:hypothetical protein [Pandoraea morbifera]